MLTNESLARLAYESYRRRIWEESEAGVDRVVDGPDFDAADLSMTLGVISSGVQWRLDGLAVDVERENGESDAVAWLEARMHDLPVNIQDNTVLLVCALCLLKPPSGQRG